MRETQVTQYKNRLFTQIFAKWGNEQTSAELGRSDSDYCVAETEKRKMLGFVTTSSIFC